jgi:hypothetical protein
MVMLLTLKGITEHKGSATNWFFDLLTDEIIQEISFING